MRNRSVLAVVAMWTLLVGGCGVNKSIHIADGETVNGGRATVNGSVYIGADCTVRGGCRTVNGRVTVGDGSKVGGLKSVNGSIKIAENVRVEGDVGTVNGSIRLESHVDVRGEVGTVNGSVVCAGGAIADDVTTVNGSIQLARTEVRGNLGTVNGSVTLEDGSRVAGNILIKGKSTRYRKKKAIEIDISGDSVVEGDIIVRHPSRDVKVILSGGGKVLGEIKGAEMIEAEP
jgi:DUF4097 and DUF4098 domain-containing protein YvlB